MFQYRQFPNRVNNPANDLHSVRREHRQRFHNLAARPHCRRPFRCQRVLLRFENDLRQKFACRLFVFLCADFCPSVLFDLDLTSPKQLFDNKPIDLAYGLHQHVAYLPDAVNHALRHCYRIVVIANFGKRAIFVNIVSVDSDSFRNRTHIENSSRSIMRSFASEKQIEVTSSSAPVFSTKRLYSSLSSS